MSDDNSDDDPIQEILGDFGRWQLPAVCMLLLFQLPLGWHAMSIIFLAPKVNATCGTPRVFDVCSTECKKYEYDRAVFKSVITSEWDLICERSTLAILSQTIVMFGLLVGSISFGVLADRYGRRIPLIVAILMLIISGVITAVSPWFWLFCLMRFINGLPVGGGMVTGFVLMMELIGKKYRESFGIGYQIPFWIGHISLIAVSYFWRNWRHYQLAYSIFTCIMVPAIFIVPESPRWLFSTGRLKESAKILEKAARINKRPSENIQAKLERAFNKLTVETDEAGNTKSGGNVFGLCKTPNLRWKTLIICFCWFSAGFGFFGLAQYSGMIAGDVYINVAISASLEIPGTLVCIVSTKYWGRKPTNILPNILGGICMIIIAFLPVEETTVLNNVKAALTSIGLACMCIVFANSYLFSAELFPTVVRNAGVGLAGMVARLASMIAPFIATMDQLWISSLIFGIIPILAAIACFFLPETKGQPLPETLEDAENFGKKRKS